MPKQTWTIGSESTCDLTVDNTTVSAQHCRLSLEEGSLTVTDLGSTNGTYLNGRRIEGTVKVDRGDRITLGQSQLMPWPPSIPCVAEDQPPAAAPKRLITIGRGSDNTIVLDEPNVSTHHARLVVQGESLILEDLGSTNGTAVGNPENKINRAEVRPGDTVYLGSSAYRVSEWLSASLASELPRAEPAPSAADRKLTTPPNATKGMNVASSLAGLLALVGAVVLLLWAIRSPEAPGPEAAGPETLSPHASGPEASGRDDALPPTERLVLSQPADTSKLDAERAAIEPSVAPAPAKQDSSSDHLAVSLYLIICTDPERKTPFRVGNGFAISARHVATSGSVIQAIRGLRQDGYTDVFLVCPANGTEIGVRAMTVHPEFESANTDALEAQQKHDAIFDQLESEPPSLDAFDQIKETLLAARRKAFEAIDRKTTFDVAVIEVEQPLAQWIDGVAPSVSIRPNQKLDVAAFCFDVQDPYYDRDTAIDLSILSCRIQRLISTDKSGTTKRLLANAGGDQRGYAYLGAPLVDSQGRVLGVYARPTPPGVDADSELPSTFDAPLFQRVQECLSLVNSDGTSSR